MVFFWVLIRHLRIWYSFFVRLVLHTFKFYNAVNKYFYPCLKLVGLRVDIGPLTI